MPTYHYQFDRGFAVVSFTLYTIKTLDKMSSWKVVFLLMSTLAILTGRLVKGQACIFTITDTNGVLDYPSDESNYTNNVNCTWEFIAPPDSVVELTFISVDLQPMSQIFGCVDAIKVYDGIPGSTLATLPFCDDGPSWPRRPHRFLSTSNRLSITLETDDSVTGMGFVAEFKHVPFRIESIAAINVDEPSIIQFNRFNIRLHERISLLQATRPSALDFDPITEFFYYTDLDVGFLGRIKNDANSDEILVKENVQTPLGVAVGYLTGLLYWTDAGRNEISVALLDGTFRKALVSSSTGCNTPRDIILSSDQQNVYWTCAGKIMKANADGSEGRTLVDDLSDPRAITLDEEMFLYWVDVATSTVGKIHTSGTLEEQLFQHVIFSTVHSFVLDSFTYYFSRPADQDIIDIEKQDPTTAGTLSPKNSVTMEGLYYYKSDRQIPPQHICSVSQVQCQELCFPRGVSYQCVEVTPVVVSCPNDIVLITSQTHRQVFWDEPHAMSRTSQQNGEILMYHTRMPNPGAVFTLGNTTVTYTFKDEFSNTALCSFNVVLLPATTTISTTVSTTAITTKPIADPGPSESPNFSLDLLVTEYLIYTILGVVIILLCVILLIVLCVVCCCRCSFRSKSQRENSTMQPQYNMNPMGHDNKTSVNMGPVGNTSNGYPDMHPPVYHSTYP